MPLMLCIARFLGNAPKSYNAVPSRRFHVLLLFNMNKTTQDMIFSVTYYLESRNAKIVYCASHFLPTIVQLVVWTL